MIDFAHALFATVFALNVCNQAAMAQVDFVVPNPSFEIDESNVGLPDDWTIPAGVVGELVTNHVSQGAKAMRFTEGYAVAAIDQKLTGLAGQTVAVSVDVAGEAGCKFGAILAYNHKQKDGASKFVYHRLTWDKPIDKAYQTLTLPLKFAADAVDGRVWLGFYRSNKEGVMYLDNFDVTSHGAITDEQSTALKRAAREWGYLASAATMAAEQTGADSAIQAIAEEAKAITLRAEQQDPELAEGLDGLLSRWQTSFAQLNALQSDGQPFAIRWSEGVLRLDPSATIPASPASAQSVASLAGAYDALGVTIWSGKPESTTFTIRLEGLDAMAQDVVVRRQVFLENWYDKESARSADALPLLQPDDGSWTLPVDGGEIVKLYIGYKTRTDAAGQHPVEVTVLDAADETSVQRLSATLDVLPVAMPAEPRLEHWQCVYMNLMPAGKYPEIAAKDLADHYVTSVQFPWAPKAVFDSEGHLISHDFNATQQSRWMHAYAPHIDKLWLFWEGSLINGGLEDQQGNKLGPFDDNGQFTQAFRTSFKELLRAWLDYAAEQGFGLEHWAIVPDDEPHSGEEWANAPGLEIQHAVEQFKLVREVEPDLEIQVTLGNYALPEDVDAILPHVDVALPIYPYPEKLSRWAPPNYNPQKAYAQRMGPALMQARRDNGLKVWSYDVSRGIKDALVSEVLTYPVQAVAQGYTGIGYWAYNVTRGQSWDDRDGGLLDYAFIYNGLEDHPLNHRYNVTNEIIVPSIRWEALRIGQQHAQVLLTLQHLLDRDRLSATDRGQVKQLLEEAATFEPYPGKVQAHDYLAFADRVVRLYARVHQPSSD